MVQLILVGVKLKHTSSMAICIFLHQQQSVDTFVFQKVDPFRGVTFPLSINFTSSRTTSSVSLTSSGNVTDILQFMAPTARTLPLLDKIIGTLSFPSLPSIFKVPQYNNSHVL